MFQPLLLLQSKSYSSTLSSDSCLRSFFSAIRLLCVVILSAVRRMAKGSQPIRSLKDSSARHSPPSDVILSEAKDLRRCPHRPIRPSIHPLTKSQILLFLKLKQKRPNAGSNPAFFFCRRNQGETRHNDNHFIYSYLRKADHKTRAFPPITPLESHS